MEHPLLIVISLISGLNALKWVIMIYKREGYIEESKHQVGANRVQKKN